MMGSNDKAGTQNLPEIKEFIISHEEAISGQKILIKWKVINALEVYLNDVVVSSEGEQEDIIYQTKEYRLVVKTGGAFKKRLTHTKKVVLAKPVIENFKFEPPEISENKHTVFSFNLRNSAIWSLRVEYFDRPGVEEVVAEGENADFLSNWNIKQSVRLRTNCQLVLKAFNSIREESTPPFILAVRKPRIIHFSPENAVVLLGGLVQLKWETEHANKIIINPGNYDVTGNTTFQYPVTQDNDFTIKLVAWGDFGETTSEERFIRVAWLGEIKTSNNDYPASPELYLSWKGAHLEEVVLNPGNRVFSCTENEIPIEPSAVPVEYELSGKTEYGTVVKHPFTLRPASIQSFTLEKGAALVGYKATLFWEVAHAVKISLDKGLGEKTGLNHVVFTVLPGMETICLTVWGETNVVTQSIDIPIFKGPEIEKLTIQMPKIEVQLDFKITRTPLSLVLNARRGSGAMVTYFGTNYNGVLRKMIVPAALTGRIAGLLPATFLMFKKALVSLCTAVRKIPDKKRRKNQKRHLP